MGYNFSDYSIVNFIENDSSYYPLYEDSTNNIAYEILGIPAGELYGHNGITGFNSSYDRCGALIRIQGKYTPMVIATSAKGCRIKNKSTQEISGYKQIRYNGYGYYVSDNIPGLTDNINISIQTYILKNLNKNYNSLEEAAIDFLGQLDILPGPSKTIWELPEPTLKTNTYFSEYNSILYNGNGAAFYAKPVTSTKDWWALGAIIKDDSGYYHPIVISLIKEYAKLLDSLLVVNDSNIIDFKYKGFTYYINTTVSNSILSTGVTHNNSLIYSGPYASCEFIPFDNSSEEKIITLGKNLLAQYEFEYKNLKSVAGKISAIKDLDEKGNSKGNTFAVAHVETVYVDYKNKKTLNNKLKEINTHISDTNIHVSVEEKEKWNTKGTYSKPSDGIPETDLTSTIQLSLNKANTALQSHQDISGKVDKEDGKGLSSNDYTTMDKNKLDSIEKGANKTVIDNELSSTSTNAIQNKIVNDALIKKANAHHTHTISDILDFPGSGTTYSKKDINTLLTVEPDINGGTVVGGSALNGEVTNLDTLKTALRNSRSFVGSVQGLNNWQNLISIRHRNGVDDGINYGMYIRADMTDVTDPKGASLIWDRDYQSGGVNKWQGERAILDSVNYELYAATKEHNHSKILDSGDNSELTFGYSKAGVTTSDFTSLACWCGTELRCVDKAQFAVANHNHSKILDSNDSRELTFAYSKTGMDSSDYNWLAAWNGSELRAVNKSHFAASNHNHDGTYAKILQGGNTAGGGGSVSISLPTNRHWIIQIQGNCMYNSSSPTRGIVRGFIYGYGKDLYQVLDSKFISVSVSGNTITISQSGWISSSDGAFGACLLQLS